MGATGWCPPWNVVLVTGLSKITKNSRPELVQAIPGEGISAGDSKQGHIWDMVTKYEVKKLGWAILAHFGHGHFWGALLHAT